MKKVIPLLIIMFGTTSIFAQQSTQTESAIVSKDAIATNVSRAISAQTNQQASATSTSAKGMDGISSSNGRIVRDPTGLPALRFQGRTYQLHHSVSRTSDNVNVYTGPGGKELVIQETIVPKGKNPQQHLSDRFGGSPSCYNRVCNTHNPRELISSGVYVDRKGNYEGYEVTRVQQMNDSTYRKQVIYQPGNGMYKEAIRASMKVDKEKIKQLQPAVLRGNYNSGIQAL